MLDNSLAEMPPPLEIFLLERFNIAIFRRRYKEIPRDVNELTSGIEVSRNIKNSKNDSDKSYHQPYSESNNV